MKPLDLFSTQVPPPADPTETKALSSGADLFSTAEGGGAGPQEGGRAASSLVLSRGETLLSRYEIQDLLGIGGMGIVYRAFDHLLERVLALKFLRPSSDPSRKARLLREVAIHERLSHPAIVRCYGLHLDPSKQIMFLATEYIPGVSLHRLLEDKKNVQPPLPFTQVLSILEDLCNAIDYAHHEGVIHRDLKPANVLVTEDSHAKLLDFGIACLEESPASPLTTGPLGSAYYMAPEQLQGQEVAATADIYALGILLHQMLTGLLPQPGMPPPSLLLPALPKAIDVPLAKALQWQPKARFQRASDLFLAVKQALQDPPRSSLAKTKVPIKTSAAASPSQGSPEKQGKKGSQGESAEGIKVVPTNGGSKTDTAAADEAATNEARGSSASLLFLSEEGSLEERWRRRLEKKRPRYRTTMAAPSKPRWSEPGDLALDHAPLWPALPPLAKDLQGRWLLSRRGLPILPLVRIPKGSFFFGATPEDRSATPFEKPGLSVDIEAFWIARIPVTYAIWQVFVEESGGKGLAERDDPLVKGGFQDGLDPAWADHPVVWISFEAAWLFCDFYGLSLPSEVQWEKAARGDRDQRLYPWGDQAPDGLRCSFQDRLGGVNPVGHLPLGSSPYGLLDASGSIQEWCADAWDARLLQRLAKEPETPCIPPSQTGTRIALRGGHAQASSADCRITARLGLPPHQTSAYTGFRPTLDL